MKSSEPAAAAAQAAPASGEATVLLCPSCGLLLDLHPTAECWYIDKSDCPYYARYQRLPGHDPEGICAYGCVDEPECITCGPWDHYVEVPVPAARGSEDA